MSTTTTNLGLIKPELTDPADITALNPNWDAIDAELKKLNDKPSVTVDSALSSTSTNPVQNKVINNALSTHTHSTATTATNGFMSATDKAKLDGIAAGATKITVDSALSNSSTNPVQNKVINSALAGKAPSTHTHDYLPLTGGTVTGTLVLSKVADADGDAYNSPALVIGGEPTTYHVELDNNEIQAKINETTPGNLFLNSNGGKVTVGEGGLEVGGDFMPTKALNSNMGTSTLPWNRIYGRYLDLCGAADSLYGRFRVSTTGTETTDGVTTLTLGNETASGTANNASGKITMYDKGTGFTNILPKTTTSGSNTVYLPTGNGTLMLDTQGCKIQTGSYTGTGTYGASNPNKLTFDFAPKYIEIVYSTSTSSNPQSKTLFADDKRPVMLMKDIGTSYDWGCTFNENPGYSMVKKSSDGKTIHWYDTQSASSQRNNKNTVYHYVAIG